MAANDVMTYINLIYLAHLTGRTAVLPPFAPSHVGSAAGFVSFSDVFDIDRLREDTGVPIIEWKDLKALSPPSELNGTERESWRPHEDILGCWSIWATAQPPPQDPNASRRPRPNMIEPHLALDISYTRVPSNNILLPQYPNDPHVSFWYLARLGFEEGRTEAHLPPSMSEGGPGAHFAAPHSKARELPDDQMMCFDFMYYVSVEMTFEMWYEWSPAWRFVGTHAHWNSTIESIAEGMIRKTFELEETETIPPFISMHVRHGDFSRYCPEGQICFAPLSTLQEYVEQVKEEVRRTKGIEVEKVLVTSDERNQEWWDGVRELGWQWVDHDAMETERLYGRW
jgi:hypothetical protein